MPFDSGQLNREHPFLFAQLQSSNDGTIVIGSGGRKSCELCHLNSPRGLAINQGYSTLAAARPHRIFTFADIGVATPSLGALHWRRGVHEPSMNAARSAMGD